MTKRALRLPAVEAKTGMKRTQILEAVKQGIFPKPFHAIPGGRAIVWDEGEIDHHLEDQMAKRNV